MGPPSVLGSSEMSLPLLTQPKQHLSSGPKGNVGESLPFPTKACCPHSSQSVHSCPRTGRWGQIWQYRKEGTYSQRADDSLLSTVEERDGTMPRKPTPCPLGRAHPRCERRCLGRALQVSRFPGEEECGQGGPTHSHQRLYGNGGE